MLASFPYPSGWAAMAERAVRSAARRRERWLRSVWRHEQLSVRMAVATATHHSWKSHAVVCSQTEYVAPACTSATVASGVNLDVTGFVSPLFSRTSVEGSASQVVDPLPPAEEFSEPVCNQVYRERFAAGETVENLVDIPVVQEQVIVQATPRVVDSLPPVSEFTVPAYNPVHQEQYSVGETTENIAKIPVVQDQVLVQAIPRFVGAFPPVDEFTAYVARRPLPLVEVRPSVRAQRHIVKDLGELAPLVQILDLLVPHMVDSVTDILRLLDRPIAKQVIEVPKISCSPCPSRVPILAPQMADQLVEVPSLFRSRSRLLTLQFLAVMFEVPSQDRAQRLVVLPRAPGEGSPDAFGTCPQLDCLDTLSPTLRRLRMRSRETCPSSLRGPVGSATT